MRRGQGDALEPVLRAIVELGWEPAGLVMANGFVARLLGMMMRAPHHGDGVPVVMCLPRTRSVHTCFMRYALDVAFADRAGHVVRLCRGVAPWQVVACREAAFTLERAAAVDDVAMGFPKKEENRVDRFSGSGILNELSFAADLAR